MPPVAAILQFLWQRFPRTFLHRFVPASRLVVSQMQPSGIRPRAGARDRRTWIDPERVPKLRLASGALMPAIGLGTFGSDHVGAQDIARAVRGAFEVGYRHFDCASVYGNEAAIGRSLSRLPREEIWVTSKLWNDKHAPADVHAACRQSLTDLRLDYLDLYVVHWPFPNAHPPGCDVTARAPDARPYVHDEFMETWRAMEELVDLGLVRHIGTSNMTIPKLQLLLGDARIRPVANEMELHPHFQQPELFAYLNAQEIKPIAFCPIGSPARPERDRALGDTVDIEDPVIVSIARAHGIHPAPLCVKWAVQRGQIPIPFSTNPDHYRENLEAVVGDWLTDDEMRAIEGIDRGCRLIKGQVFLWREGQSWEDLWDPDGAIAR
jgi:alcohol dehydrogenase (NADP+)